MPPARTKEIAANPYHRLVAAIREEIAGSKRVIEQRMVDTYWQVGRMIRGYQRLAGDAGPSGVALYQRLGEDLDINYRVLYQAAQFADVYPKLNHKLPLTWSHYRYLCQIRDPQERARWEKRIVRERIGVHQFQALLMAKKGVPAVGRARRTEIARGLLYHYRLTMVESVHTESSRLMVDCGFNNLIEPPTASGKPVNKYIYKSSKEGGAYALKSTKAGIDQIYTYRANVQRVVDGDTFACTIDNGFGIFRRERLRLKDIDAPERKTIAGRRVGDWVKARLAKNPQVVIKTYKSDKYDRYLTDLFYGPKGADPHLVAAEGPCLNDELLQAGLARRWQA